MNTVSAGIRSTRNADGGIVLDIDRGLMFRLNPLGALVLEAIAKGCTQIEIAKEIARQCDIGEETAASDVGEFVKSLEQHGIVRAPQGEKES